MSLNELFAAQEACAERWLLFYPARKQEHEHAVETIIYGCSKPADAGKSTHISRVTESKALRLSKTWADADWISAVEYCMGSYTNQQRLLLDIRWRQTQGRTDVSGFREPWIEDAILHYADRTGHWPHVNTVSAWWRDMVTTLARWVALKGGFNE